MSQNLHSTTVAALDELHSLIGLQELLEIVLEQLQRADLAPEERQARTVLLIISNTASQALPEQHRSRVRRNPCFCP